MKQAEQKQSAPVQAKILIFIGNEDGGELADALFERSARLDERGEIEFYQALLLIRQGPQQAPVLRLLEQARAKVIRMPWRCSTRSTRNPTC